LHLFGGPQKHSLPRRLQSHIHAPALSAAHVPAAANRAAPSFRASFAEALRPGAKLDAPFIKSQPQRRNLHAKIKPGDPQCAAVNRLRDCSSRAFIPSQRGDVNSSARCRCCLSKSAAAGIPVAPIARARAGSNTRFDYRIARQCVLQAFHVFVEFAPCLHHNFQPRDGVDALTSRQSPQS